MKKIPKPTGADFRDPRVPAIDVERFVDAQHDDFARALGEIEAGRKQSHWMWYVFPQVTGLGASGMSIHYAIGIVAEAGAFLAHPVLGPRYRQMVNAVWHQVVEGGTTIHNLFGSPDDAKLVSSLTLFAGAARRLDAAEPDLRTFITQVDEVLEAASTQGLARCTTTEIFIEE
ncbi:MAG: DUF1810 family protein [Ilumatobacteraceae bacterium]